MSDTEINETAEETEAEAPETEEAESTEEEEFDRERAIAKIRKANSEAKNLRERLKKFEDAEREREEASKSELQRAVERAEAAEKKLAELEFNALRNEIALSKGLTPAQAKRLQGATKEELESDADELLETFGGIAKSINKRAGKLRGGSNPDDDSKDFDPKGLAEKLRNRR